MTMVIPISYIFIDRFPMVLFLAALGVLAVIIDFLRIEVKPIGRFFSHILGKILWDREKHTFTGATTYALAAVLSVYFFDKWVAIAVLLFLAFGDTAAYIIGVKWGITYFDSEKTIEGSVACLIICLGISLLLPEPDIFILLVGAVIASAVELFPLGVDDNIALPLISGVAMEVLIKRLGGL
jgi:glycerol-3-phosphate acyltransferase PlsY